MAKNMVVDVVAKKAGGKIVKTAAKNIPGTQLLEAVSQGLKILNEYKTVEAQEKTKRAEIAAGRDISVEKIRAQRDLIKSFLDRTFDERKQVLTAQIKVLDRAIDKGDTAALKLALDSMLTVIKSSPFENIADMHAQLEAKDFVLRLD